MAPGVPGIETGENGHGVGSWVQGGGRCAFNLGTTEANVYGGDFLPQGNWENALSSAEPAWKGPGDLHPERIHGAEAIVQKAQSFVVYVKEGP